MEKNVYIYINYRMFASGVNDLCNCVRIKETCLTDTVKIALINLYCCVCYYN